jgi:predicted kinase
MTNLYIFAGLPGTGKSTLAQKLAQHVNAVHLRIDTIEQGLRDLCDARVQGEGYRLAYRIAADNLRLGIDVIADSCNPLELTRREWEQVAEDNQAAYINIEVVCSDTDEHRQRIERQSSTVPGLKLPTWSDVQKREYHDWTKKRILIDTAGRLPGKCLDQLIESIRATDEVVG